MSSTVILVKALVWEVIDCSGGALCHFLLNDCVVKVPFKKNPIIIFVSIDGFVYSQHRSEKLLSLIVTG